MGLEGNCKSCKPSLSSFCTVLRFEDQNTSNASNASNASNELHWCMCVQYREYIRVEITDSITTRKVSSEIQRELIFINIPKFSISDIP